MLHVLERPHCCHPFGDFRGPWQGAHWGRGSAAWAAQDLSSPGGPTGGQTCSCSPTSPPLFSLPVPVRRPPVRFVGFLPGPVRSEALGEGGVAKAGAHSQPAGVLRRLQVVFFPAAKAPGTLPITFYFSSSSPEPQAEILRLSRNCHQGWVTVTLSPGCALHPSWHTAAPELSPLCPLDPPPPVLPPHSPLRRALSPGHAVTLVLNWPRSPSLHRE